ncbi:unnamed protein product, partial [Ectocarpus fasciculatus]
MSGWGDRQAEEGEENDEDGLEDEFRSTEDHVLFLIDARSAMFARTEAGEAYIVNCLRVVQNVMKTKIVASERSRVGVILFGAVTVVTAGVSQVVPLFSLDVPSATRLKALEDGAGLEDVLSTAGGVKTETASGQALCPLREALWACAQAFHAVGSKQRAGDSKRLWLFTNDDRPNDHDLSEQARIVQVARDCAETGVELSLWCMPPQGGAGGRGGSFDTERFYSAGVDTSDGFAGDDGEEILSLCDRIQSCGYAGFDAKDYKMRRREHRKRRLGTLTLNLHRPGEGGAAIAMGMYKLIHPASRPQYTYLQSHSNLPTKFTSVLMDTTTAAVLDEGQVSTYLDFNGLRVPLTPGELKAVKAPDSSQGVPTPYVNLLYFIPRDALSTELQLKDSTFLFPDDSTISSSMGLFRCLLRQLLSKGLVGVGHMQRTAGSEGRLVALLPCDEQTDADRYMEQAGGLFAIPLPFIQDIRNVIDPTTGESVISSEDPSIAAAMDLVKGMQFGASFRYTELENPGIQHFYAMLQAIALADDQCEWQAGTDDMLQPDAESLVKHESLITAFCEAIG